MRRLAYVGMAAGFGLVTACGGMPSTGSLPKVDVHVPFNVSVPHFSLGELASFASRHREMAQQVGSAVISGVEKAKDCVSSQGADCVSQDQALNIGAQLLKVACGDNPSAACAMSVANQTGDFIGQLFKSREASITVDDGTRTCTDKVTLKVITILDPTAWLFDKTCTTNVATTTP